ncbi:hypothetical protein GPL15_02705 [Clostridium sp. MCC353]|uniref:LamG-like jellyroll fold domain-containing protein n=1 Tax=Clostridium sp. MCC353 TaxID=2592646 RepID=UPI001C016B70|nr:LamG-like jellyroll fold domain-containing protein [Clostridium sp. MCC353]MBT9775418.1 hypothetical protein [Clostridium sp. MCC353]
MWNRKRVASLVLGIAVTSSSMMQGMPVYASNADMTNGQIAEELTEGLLEEAPENLTENVTDESTEEQTEDSTENLTEESTEDSLEESTEGSTEESTEESNENTTEVSTEDLTEESPENSTEDLTEESTEDSTEDLTEESRENSTEDITEKSPENSTEDITKESTEASTEESKNDTSEEIKKTENESKEDPTEKPREDLIDKTMELLPDHVKIPDKIDVATPANASKLQNINNGKTHIAVFAGTIPEIDGITWAEVVNEDDFQTPYSTVPLTADDDTEFLVEVVPENLVYFVDCAANNDSPAYDAIADLTGSTLKNKTADAPWADGSVWGYTGVKSAKSGTDASDKDDTGFYGNDGAGHPISYQFTLDPGTYTITSSHNDWWKKDRPMSMRLSYDGKVLNAGTVNSSGTNEFTFTLDEKQTVAYAINNTAWEAAVVSWIAIEESDAGDVPPVISSEALEDIGEVTARTGASLLPDYGEGDMLVVSSEWIDGGNSAVNGGGVITDAPSYLKKPQFTFFTDFTFNSSHDNTSALLIGNADNHFRLIPRKSDGKALLRSAKDGKDTDFTIKADIAAGAWHSIAVLYEEDGDQGYVTLCLDGAQILDSAGLGYKLSEQDDLTAGFGITYKTGFMRSGKYDNITVVDGFDVEAAKEETKERADFKNSNSAERIVIDGKAVEKAAENMNGLTFKGFGVLDCNSTNALLLDYKAQQPEKYWEMMEVLFGGENPIMQHIKVEMGNDKNNSTGSQACTMRTSDEYPDVTRVTGFQLAADAKKINPNVKVSLLYWRSPGWVGSNRNNIYKWMKNTSIAAYREYGYMVDMISPGVNEEKDDPNWMKQFNQWVENDTEGMISNDPSVAGFRDEEADLFHKIQIIMSDEVGIASCGPQLTGDAALRDAVEIIGYHYNTNDDSAGSFTRLAEEFDKEIWNSEAQATFGSTADRPNNNMEDNADPGTGIGGNGSALEMANTVIKGFVNSRRTHFVYQPTFGAFYEGTQYNYKDVMAARDPWSGYVNFDGALNIMQHFTKFAVTGWEYDTPDENVVWRAIPSASKSTATGTNPVNGRNGEDNYMTLAAPDKSGFSVIINNDSGRTKTFTIYPRDMELGVDAQLEVWETREADEGQVYNENYMKCVDTLSPAEDGTYVVTVKPWSIVTVTSLDMDGRQEELALPTASEDGRYVLDTDETGKVQNTEDGYLYVDDFDYETMGNVSDYEDGQIIEDGGKSFIESRGGRNGFYPLYTQDTNGTFEVVMDESGNGVLRMNGQTGGSCWNGGEPATILGDYRWTNYKVSVDFNLNSTSEYLLLGARQRGSAGGGDNKVSMSAYNVAMNRNGNWILRRHSAEIAKGTVQVKNPGACNAALKLAGDTITLYIEGEEIYTYTDPNPQLEGRIMLGVGLPGGNWGAGEFDNLKVETIPGYTPYFTMIHDNLHMKEWGGDNAGGDALVYDGNWSHRNQVGSNVSQRTLSSTSETGAGISYTFNGTGLALIGPNGGSAKVNVEADGKTIYMDAPTIATNSHQPFFILRGLENGEHTVRISLASGRLEVDSVGYITPNESTGRQVDLSGLQETMAAMDNLNESDYDADSWKAFQDALDAAHGNRWNLEVVNRIISDPAGYGADQETVNEIAGHYREILDKLLRNDAPVEIISTEGIPQFLAVPVNGTLADIKGGTLPDTVSVRNLNGTTNDAAKITWTLSGDTGVAYGSAKIIGTVVGGKNLTVTVNAEVVPSGMVYFIDPGTDDQTIYNLYKAASPELKNDTNDKISENGSWGRNVANLKGDNRNPFDKLDTGIFSSEDIVYTLPLGAGIYTVTAGFTEWWGYGRDMSQTISYKLADGTTKTVKGEAVSFGAKGSAVSSTTFMLPEDAAVTYTLSKTKSQDSVISWLAVTKTGIGEETSWGPVFESNESNQWAGLLTSGTVVTREDDEQGQVLHMNAAGTTYVQFDPQAIDFTSRETMTMGFDLKSETADGNFFTLAIGQDNNKYFYMRTRKDSTYTAITKESYDKEQGAEAQVETYNKWVRVDLVFTPEQIILYMDGVPASTIDKDILMTDLGKNPSAYLGKSFYSGDKYFAGAFDNIEVYNRARSAGELSLSYLAGKAGRLKKEEYTSATWNVFETAFKEAGTVLADASASAEQRTAAQTKLQSAMDGLVKGTNMGDLEELVNKAEGLKEAEYTQASWTAFADALTEAKEVLTNASATKEEKDGAKAKLQKAMDELKKAADTAGLAGLVELAEKLKEKDYTTVTWKALEKALAEAKAVLADASAAEEELSAAQDKLQAAVDSLIKADSGSDNGSGSEDSNGDGWDEDSDDGGSGSSSSSGSSAAGSRNRAKTSASSITEVTGSIPSTTKSGTWKPMTDGTWKLVKKDGTTAKNEWAQIDNKWYLFDANSQMAQGWAKANDIWYYFDPVNGDMRTGWQMVNNNWYYFDPAVGNMETGWRLIEGKWYYMDPVNGDMKKGRIQVNGLWFTLGEDGSWVQ